MVTTIPNLRFRIEEVAGHMPERLRWELIEGELQMMSPAGEEHGRIAFRIGRILDRFVHPQRLGELYAAETGFILTRDPDTVRAPDLAFVRTARIEKTTGFIIGAPDLAVEVVSPHDKEPLITSKAHQWLDAGAQAVWLVWPRDRRVTVYTKDAPPRDFNEADTLTGEPALPGFTCRVAEIFE